MSDQTVYKYGGAKAMVELHAKHMRSFLETWRKAKASGVVFAATDDPDYESMETLLRHVCRAGRGYMTWMCGVLDLPDPGIEEAPETDAIEAEAARYIDHLLRQWDGPLAEVEEKRFYAPEYPSRWKTSYCVDAMMEHAVMHPIRHEHQLKKLMSRPR
jgi:uncharacterized damage-inducible protein DinB